MCKETLKIDNFLFEKTLHLKHYFRDLTHKFYYFFVSRSFLLIFTTFDFFNIHKLKNKYLKKGVTLKQKYNTYLQ